MMFVMGETSEQSADLWFTAYTVVLFVVLPLTVLGAGIWHRLRRHGKDAAPNAGWAMALLVLVRVYLALAVVVSVLDVLGVDTGEGRQEVRGATLQNGALTIRAEGPLWSMCRKPPTAQTRAEAKSRACRVADAWSRGEDVSEANPSPTGKTPFDLRVDQLRGREHETFAVFGWLGWLVPLLGVVAVERILYRTTKRRPFSFANVVWLRLLAVVIAVQGWLLVLLGNHYVDRLLTRYAADDVGGSYLRRIGAETPNSLAPLGVAALILVLAEVWRFGIRLQDDVEATV